jgi:hypothetical protein
MPLIERIRCGSAAIAASLISMVPGFSALELRHCLGFGLRLVRLHFALHGELQTRKDAAMKPHVCRIRRPHTNLLTCLIGLVAAALGGRSMAGSYSFTLIADNSGMFNAFNNPGLSADAGIPSISNSGEVAFWATLDAGGSGIFKGDAAVTLTMAVTGPLFTSFQRGYPVNNDAGTVGFWAARPPSAGGGHGIFTAGFMAGTLCTSTTGVYVGINDSPSIDPAGSNLGFRADPVGGGAGIYRAAIGGGTTTIATGASGLSSEGPALNSAGSCAFVGSYSGVSGVHVGTGALAGPATIADTSGIFSGFGPICSINAAGTVAFRANLDAGGSGIYKAAVGAAPMSVATTSLGGFSSFSTPSINSAGHIIFRAVGGITGEAIYRGPDVVTDRVIGWGDVLGGKTVSSVRTGRQALNDDDQFAFRVVFADATSAIYRANYCRADATGDGVTNVDDILAVIGAWGACPAPCPPTCASDIDQNCIVNVNDLLAVIHGWGVCP